MKVSDFLSPANVFGALATANKERLLEELAKRAAALVDLRQEVILSGLRKREELGSTGTGGGVALPHARFHGLTRPVAIFAHLKKPIDFEAVDAKPVDIVALLLLPDGQDGAPLGALACLARKLREPAITAALRQAHDNAEIYRLLTAD